MSGAAETMLKKLAAAEESKRPAKLESRSFGALFILDLIEKELDTIGIIDSIVHRGIRETGLLSVSISITHAWANRLVSPRSKRALVNCYSHKSRKLWRTDT